MTGTLYIRGHSPLHRIPAGIKLAALCLFGLALFASDNWIVMGLAAAVSLGLLASTGIDPAQARRQLTGPFIIVAFLMAATALLVDPLLGLAVGLRLMALLVAGYAVTLTTPVSAMLEVIERLFSPLDRIGLVSSAKIALSVSLVFRFIPVLIDQARVIREAQAARGMEKNILALLVPLIVHVLRSADDIAAAIDARGYPPADGANRGNAHEHT